MNKTCLIIRFFTSLIGLYNVLRFIWIELEKIQFGADVFANSWVDTGVCLLIAIVIEELLFYGEHEW